MAMRATPQTSLEVWPGAQRRRPPKTSATWAMRSALASWLEREAAGAPRGAGLRILDVGCGPKPYYPFFAARAAEYVGVDVTDNGAADLLGRVEDLPVPDASFDLVLCTQVLEHCEEPAQAVRELRRVTAPGGRVLASTHGVQVYHPCPQDFWRWTHEGLRRLFEQNAKWASLDVAPAVGTAATIAMLAGIFTEIAARRAGWPKLARYPVWALNRTGTALDSLIPLLNKPVPGSLIANFHVTATVASP